MELNKCPNCSGKLALAKNRKRLVCSYCGSEFPLDEATKNEIGDQPVNMDWFIYDWDFENIKANDSCKTVAQSFIRCLNDFETSSGIEAYIREYLMGFEDVSANGIREENMRDVVRRLMPSFLPGERVVLFYDDGVLIHGKTGIVITNKRTFFISVHSSLRGRLSGTLSTCRFLILRSRIRWVFRESVWAINIQMISEAAADLSPTLSLKVP